MATKQKQLEPSGIKNQFLSDLNKIEKSPIKSAISNSVQVIGIAAFTAKNYMIPMAVDSALEAYQAISELDNSTLTTTVVA